MTLSIRTISSLYMPWLGKSFDPVAQTGVNVLLGTKVAIPIDGPVRENVGLLGSPAFLRHLATSSLSRKHLRENPANIQLAQAIALGITPFAAFDILKALVAAVIARPRARSPQG